MPNEPEKPIEPALRAYAQKRRDDAGAPLELHPATRQLWQGEVARTLAKLTGEAPSRFQFLVTAWPRLAFGGAIFATLVFVLVLMQSGNRVGPGGSTMTLAKQESPTAAGAELRKYATPPTAADTEGKDRDEAAPLAPAGGLSQPPPKPMTAVPLEMLNEVKSDAYVRTMPAPAPAPPMPRSFKPAEPARRGGEEMSRQDLSIKGKSDPAGAKASGAPAAAAVAGGSGAAQGLGRESSGNLDSGNRPLAQSRGRLGATMDQETKPADRINPPTKPPVMMRAVEGRRTTLAEEKRLANQPLPAAAPQGVAMDAGKPMKRAERANKLNEDESGVRLTVTPAPALPTATSARFAAFDSKPTANNKEYFFKAGGDLRLGFAQEDSRAKYRENLNSPPVPNVLTTFQLERVGNAIRIIDADGSTYSGQIIPGDAGVILSYSDDAAAELFDATKKEKQEKSLKDNIAQRGTLARAGSAGNAPAAGFSFQATGTNQTLNQSVQFFGTIVLDSAETRVGEAIGGSLVKAKAAVPARSKEPALERLANPAKAGGPQTNGVSNSSGLLRGRIQGKAVVGGKNQFEINAVPMSK